MGWFSSTPNFFLDMHSRSQCIIPRLKGHTNIATLTLLVALKIPVVPLLSSICRSGEPHAVSPLPCPEAFTSGVRSCLFCCPGATGPNRPALHHDDDCGELADDGCLRNAVPKPAYRGEICRCIRRWMPCRERQLRRSCTRRRTG